MQERGRDEEQENAADREYFNTLKRLWKKDTKYLGSSSMKLNNENYRKIIEELGPRAIPFILEDIQEDGADHWSEALMEITGQNPTREEDRGNINKQCESWLEWGREMGFIKK